MENNERLVTDVTENVEEQATEELVNGAKAQTTDEVVNTVDEATVDTESVEEKLYTKADLQTKIDNAVRRREAKLRREYDEKYGDLENVLKAGTGSEDIRDITDTFADFYTKKGINIPQRNNFNQFDMEAGAEKEAESIINSGLDEVIEEVDRLADKGLEGMNPREKIIFQHLAEYRQNKERESELISVGAKDVLNDAEFTKFASQFNSDVSIKDVYNMWTKTRPMPKVEQIGSMKNTTSNEVKDYYTPEEARRLTDKDLDNPEVMKAVERSMTVWYEKGIE